MGFVTEDKIGVCLTLALSMVILIDFESPYFSGCIEKLGLTNIKRKR